MQIPMSYNDKICNNYKFTLLVRHDSKMVVCWKCKLRVTHGKVFPHEKIVIIQFTSSKLRVVSLDHEFIACDWCYILFSIIFVRSDWPFVLASFVSNFGYQFSISCPIVYIRFSKDSRLETIVPRIWPIWRLNK